MSNVKPQDIADLQKLLLSNDAERQKSLDAWFHTRSRVFGNEALAVIANREYYSPLRLLKIVWSVVTTTCFGSMCQSFLFPKSVSLVSVAFSGILFLILETVFHQIQDTGRQRLRLRATLLLLERQDERCLRFLAAQWTPSNPSLMEQLMGELTRRMPEVAWDGIPTQTRAALGKLFHRVWRTNLWRDLPEEQSDLMLTIAHYLMTTQDTDSVDLLQRFVRKPAWTPYRKLVQETVVSLLTLPPPVPPLSFGTAVQPAPVATVVGQRRTNS